MPEARPAWSIHVIDMFGASLVQLSSFIANFDHRERNPTHTPGCWVHERKCHSGAARSPRMLPRKSLCCDHYSAFDSATEYVHDSVVKHLYGLYAISTMSLTICISLTSSQSHLMSISTSCTRYKSNATRLFNGIPKIGV